MHRVSSADLQAGTGVSENNEEGDQGHSEVLSFSELNERSSSDPEGDVLILEERPPYLRRSSVTDEGRRWQRQRGLLFPFELVSEVIRIIMNAAVTIFGMGVGVGLILGDSFRPSSVDGDAEEEATVEGSRSSAPFHEQPSSLEETGRTTAARSERVIGAEASSLSRPLLSDLPPQ
uniref:Uncharacterized protein n=1 Tax=Odontella aurita TaxID=265563 RepID=A0A6U6K1E2_9STRA|mmetsp:Transcript_58120/g.173457  ORF Transcript_58120/g.173457 Transcript_58120/m.173457 type:complete len:176 (+) Transcript_58120:487-1014(+)|eukprot:CAMPEP_0113541956 /NCGR_PEP_ID=MMETSP0015_2-20120614/9330_1 /TAXON_ID=2838 /ORGANISM="Odontella" /LENGTH=175 /DNA_ID=CAMNT_0000441941 /DNA_START=486 /DNA_END=1013 /DNA_ORIENTATION=+ /assembly_acc=CAM_ASM_000160